MSAPMDTLLDDLRSACCRAIDRGMSLDQVLEGVRTLDAQVRLAAKAKRPDRERLEQIQPPFRRDDWRRDSRTDAPRMGVRPMSRLVGDVMGAIR